MAINAVYGYPRMGAIFGGMLISGKQAAELAVSLLNQKLAKGK
jgi:thiamine thiazole synthase